MGKKAKEHRKKVAKRNRIIAQDKKRYEKLTKEMFSKILAEQEQQFKSLDPTMNLFDTNGPLSIPTTQVIPNSIIQSGPQI